MKGTLACLFLIWSVSGTAQKVFTPELEALAVEYATPFCFGVASGDPHQNRVTIWTKIYTPENKDCSGVWQVASDTLFEHIVQQGDFFAAIERAFTVKVTVGNLSPGSFYYYRFKLGNGAVSPVGRTKTAPAGLEDLKFAVVSCNNYEAGYFNAFRLTAMRSDLDAVVHLGDYIYEGASSIGSTNVVRRHLPQREILSLTDYRSRYAQYRLDPDLQEAHRLFPFIAVWDDHEFANNAYSDGASNHQTAEGDWEERKKIARKVYFEWIPIEDNPGESIIRSFSYGPMADLFMIDSRIEGRAKQLEDPDDPKRFSEQQTMLGSEQLEWLKANSVSTEAKWMILGNQVMFSELNLSGFSKRFKRNLDAWDGYPAERNKLIEHWSALGKKNLIVLTGDIHTAWAFDLWDGQRSRKKYRRGTGNHVLGAEFVVPSVSSTNLDERMPRWIARLAESVLKHPSRNRPLRFVNLADHGYVLLDVQEERVSASWIFSATVKDRTPKFIQKNRWVYDRRAGHLVREK